MLKRRKDFLEQLKERAKSTGGARSGTHRAAFTAVRELVEAARADGYAAKIIWQQLSEEGRVSMNYATFLRYCRALDHARRPAPDAAAGSAPN
jgi:hypothetical protein